jgi:hypothetical protein
MLHVDTFTVLDGTLYSKVKLGGAAIWHQSLDEQIDHPVNLDHALSVFCFFPTFAVGHTHPSGTFHGTSGTMARLKANTSWHPIGKPSYTSAISAK